MSRLRLEMMCATVALLTTTVAASNMRSPKRSSVKREIIAVYLGTSGTDSGMIETVRDMRVALARQTSTTGRNLVLHGVSLEPTVEDGIRHLSIFGAFDEVSLGGNWTNSAVVRYLGPDMSNHSRALIPQVVLLEREVQNDGSENLVVGVEREIGRHVGAKDITSWVRSGAPLPR